MIWNRFLKRRSWRKRIDPEILSAVESSGLFSAAWYLAHYDDVRHFKLGPLEHFVEFGIYEKRDPGPGFSTNEFIRRLSHKLNDDEIPFLVAMRDRTPETEYLWTPNAPDLLENALISSGLFDADWYLNRYVDLTRSNVNALYHYVRNGARELRSPGPNFNAETYAETFPEYKDLFLSPIEHYLYYGKARGYPPQGTPPYENWISKHDVLEDSDQAAIRSDIAQNGLSPIRVLCVFDDADVDTIEPFLDNLSAQLSPDWHAHLLSRQTSSRPISLSNHRQSDPRVSLGTADQFSVSTWQPGETLLLCCGTAVLRQHTAYVFARALDHAGAAGAYSDHDAIFGDERSAPVFKPEMSPEYLRRRPYVGPVVALADNDANRAALVETITNSLAADATMAADLLKRLDPASVIRIPFILYHLRTSGSPAPEMRGASAIKAAVSDPFLSEVSTKPEFTNSKQPTVSIIIPTRDRGELLAACLESIWSETAYPAEKIEIVVVDNDTTEIETLDYFKEIGRLPNVKIIQSPGVFNFSRLNNQGANASEGAILILLNNDTTVRDKYWLSKLVHFVVDKSIGVVGAKLLYPDDTIQHGGVVLGYQGVGGHRLTGQMFSRVADTDVTREMTCVTGACIAIRKEVFLEVGGLDPILEVAFNDVMLCARVFSSGYRNIYIADPILYHHESKSRGFDDTDLKIVRNLREGNYVTSHFSDLFRNDPSYSPNLSLTQVIDDLAHPPRIVRPWRRFHHDKPKILFLSCVHGIGYGVPIVLKLQAEAMRRRGWNVTIGGATSKSDTSYPGCKRVDFKNEKQAADYAVSNAIDVVVAHTPPFFNVARMVGQSPICYAVDHGEPPPSFFADEAWRKHLNNEKRRSAPFSRRVFTISRAIWGQQSRPDAVILRNGNSHLAQWGTKWEDVRRETRAKLGFKDKFVIFNVCRFQREERAYKGVDHYVSVAQEFGPLYPELKDQCVFVVAGRGSEEDIRKLRSEGLLVYANVSDEDMSALYAASDLYMSFSKWEGYNLGVGQALAMGLKVIASDIEAHREFPIEITNSALEASVMLASYFEVSSADGKKREAFIENWDEPLEAFCDVIEGDLPTANNQWC